MECAHNVMPGQAPLHSFWLIIDLDRTSAYEFKETELVLGVEITP